MKSGPLGSVSGNILEKPKMKNGKPKGKLALQYQTNQQRVIILLCPVVIVREGIFGLLVALN